MTEKPSLRKRMRERRRRWSEYRPSKTSYFWSCVICVFATIVLGFTCGGWTTEFQADRMADAAARNARAELAANYCVARFEHSRDEVAQFAALKKAAPWNQDGFIADNGWVTLPGTNGPVTDAADLCAQKLLALHLSPGNAEAGPAAKPAGSSG